MNRTRDDDIVAERLRILFHRFPRRGIQVRVVWPETSALTKMFGQALPGGQSLSAAAMTLKDRLCQALQQQLNCAPKFASFLNTRSGPSKKRSKRQAKMFFEIEPESWDRGNGDGLQSNLLSKSKAIGMQKIDIDPDNFILSDDMTGMLKITEGHGNQLMFKCPMGHGVRGGQAPLAGSSLVQRYQHCNVCLEGLQEKESLDVGDPTHCLMCGYAVCAQCLAKRTWLNSLFPAGGRRGVAPVCSSSLFVVEERLWCRVEGGQHCRTWMRLYMEGLESQGSFVCFESFKLLWLGQDLQQATDDGAGSEAFKREVCQHVPLPPKVSPALGAEMPRRVGRGTTKTRELHRRRLCRADRISDAAAKKKTKLPGIKLVIFDFDLTLAAVHVFHNLTGGAEGQGVGSCIASPPWATTERGQVRRLIDLGPAFSFKALGGEPRVRLLSETLRRLKEYEIDLIICTKGWDRPTAPSRPAKALSSAI
eukprot:s2491_g2.t1